MLVCSVRSFLDKEFGMVTLFMNSRAAKKLCWVLIRTPVYVLVSPASEKRKLQIH